MLRELRLGVGGDGAKDARADAAGHLHQQQSHAARGRVHQAGVARFQRESGMRQIMRGHALQHGRGCRLETDAVGDLHQLRGRDHRVFGVGTARHGIRYAIAGRQFGDAARPTASTVPAPSDPSVAGRSALYKPMRK